MRLFRFTFHAMACDNVIELYAPSQKEADAAGTAATAEVLRIEAKYSRYRDDSVVSRINRAAGVEAVELDDETTHLLDFAAVCYQQSSGLFDITSGILRRAWNFRAARPPEAVAISPLLPLIGWPLVERHEGRVFLSRPGMEIDFGGFGKEYAADRAAAVLLSFGFRHAYVNLGGDAVVTGPHADGNLWHLGIRHPRREHAMAVHLPIASGAVATSGDYERFIDYGGRRYSHILNPRTGTSVSGFQSVTVFAPTCLVAGSVSTIAMLKGREEGGRWLEDSGAAFYAIDEAGEVLASMDPR